MTIAEILEAKVRAAGKAEGEAKGVRKSILALLAARGLHVPEAIRERIEACTDIETLDQWLVTAATIERVDDLLGD